MKLRIRKMGMLWWLWRAGDIPELLGQFVHFTDLLARGQVECNPLMKEECDRKENATRK